MFQEYRPCQYFRSRTVSSLKTVLAIRARESFTGILAHMQLLTELSQAVQTFDFFIATAVFVSYVVVDAMYAYYTFAIANRRAMRAATTGALMHFLLAVGVLSYVENILYLIPIAAGSWLGTFLVVSWQERKHNPQIPQ